MSGSFILKLSLKKCDPKISHLKNRTLKWNVTPRLLPGVWDFDFISHYDLLFCLQFCATALVCQHETAGRGMAIRVQYHETANKKVNKGKYLFAWHAGLCVTAGYLRDNFLFVVVVCGRFFLLYIDTGAFIIRFSLHFIMREIFFHNLF